MAIWNSNLVGSSCGYVGPDEVDKDEIEMAPIAARVSEQRAAEVRRSIRVPLRREGRAGARRMTNAAQLLVRLEPVVLSAAEHANTRVLRGQPKSPEGRLVSTYSVEKLFLPGNRSVSPLAKPATVRFWV